jgi:8-oxo-dGTP pyrophosphatase MutT (NUDIX family)
MPDARVRFVDVYVLRGAADALEILLLRRGTSARCPGSWETVHGRIEPGESPLQAARRELAEEAGLVPLRLYNASRVESFYLHQTDEVALIPVFAAFVATDAPVRLSNEHDAFAWHSVAEAAKRFAWPRERRAIADIGALLGAGDAGTLEDVLRIGSER